jgi:hypothetical protein
VWVREFYLRWDERGEENISIQYKESRWFEINFCGGPDLAGRSWPIGGQQLRQANVWQGMGHADGILSIPHQSTPWTFFHGLCNTGAIIL